MVIKIATHDNNFSKSKGPPQMYQDKTQNLQPIKIPTSAFTPPQTSYLYVWLKYSIKTWHCSLPQSGQVLTFYTDIELSKLNHLKCHQNTDIHSNFYHARLAMSNVTFQRLLTLTIFSHWTGLQLITTTEREMTFKAWSL